MRKLSLAGCMNFSSTLFSGATISDSIFISYGVLCALTSFLCIDWSRSPTFTTWWCFYGAIKRYQVIGVIILNIIESYLTKKYHHVLLTSFWVICLFPEWFCMERWIASKNTSLVRRLCFFFRWCITVLLQLLFSGQKGHPYHRLRSWETFIWSWTDSVDMFEYWQYGHWDSPSAVMVKFCSLSIAKEGWGQFIGTFMDWSRAVLSLICSVFSSWCSLVSILSPFSCTRLMVINLN